MKTIFTFRHREWGLLGTAESVAEYANSIGAELEDCEALKEQSEEEFWLEKLPHEFRGVISGMAYDIGHSYGEDEILLYLKRFVDCLLPPIQQFEERIREEP